MNDITENLFTVLIMFLAFAGVHNVITTVAFCDRVPAGVYQRSVNNGFAHYDTQTAKLVWDDTRVFNVVEGVR